MVTERLYRNRLHKAYFRQSGSGRSKGSAQALSQFHPVQHTPEGCVNSGPEGALLAAGICRRQLGLGGDARLQPAPWPVVPRFCIGRYQPPRVRRGVDGELQTEQGAGPGCCVQRSDLSRETAPDWKWVVCYRLWLVWVCTLLLLLVWLLSRVRLVGNPRDCSPPGFSVHGIFQARILEWVAIPSSRGFSRPRDRTCISCIGR